VGYLIRIKDVLNLVLAIPYVLSNFPNTQKEAPIKPLISMDALEKN
jgi:hypothetical protein